MQQYLRDILGYGNLENGDSTDLELFYAKQRNNIYHLEGFANEDPHDGVLDFVESIKKESIDNYENDYETLIEFEETERRRREENY